jgi:succinate dehydrogenase/fumarate reductase flavoprotein subunit
MRVLYKQVQNRGIQVMHHTPATELLTNSKGEVLGVQAKSSVGGGKVTHIKSRRGVILTTGGFEFNEEMKLQYLRAYPVYFLGSPANTGDGIRMALGTGAQLWHMNCCSGRLVMKFPELPVAFNPTFGGKDWSSPGRSVIADPGSTHGKLSLMGRAGYIVVDRWGKRYTKETFKPHTLHYELIGFDSQKLVYPRIPSYWICDQRRMTNSPLARLASGPAGPAGIYKWSADNSKELERGWIKQGDTVKDLARKIGVDPESLTESVRNYNLYCKHGEDVEFQREPISLVPLETPPYYAVELWPGGPNTQGGPKRNSRAQVMRADGSPVPRLYSAGELGSIYGMLYPSGGGNLAECIAFGRIAGENASGEKPL